MTLRIAIILLIIPAALRSALAAEPIVNPGECLYLVGAPAGAPMASDEVTFEGTEVEEYCGAIATVGTRAWGDHSVQIHVGDGLGTGTSSCTARAWVGHAFRVPAGRRATWARVDMAGAVRGVQLRDENVGQSSLHLLGIVEEQDPRTLEFYRVSQVLIYEWIRGARRLELDREFRECIPFVALGDRIYRVRLMLESSRDLVRSIIDFGPPGTGRGAWYDSIEVCVEAEPVPPVAPADPRIDVMELADLELRLYNKECLPRVWMPAAQSGRLEAARQIVADRLAQATATGDPGVNARVATQKLAAADADIASGQYQRACRSLSDSLRALTTP